MLLLLFEMFGAAIALLVTLCGWEIRLPGANAFPTFDLATQE
jgi:hypothetical protein